MLAIDWNRGTGDLRTRVGGQVDQKGGNLRRLHPLRAIGLGVAFSISGGVHGSR